MGTSAGPRIDDRLRRFIEGSPEHAAEVTRRVGALAWDLLLPRPSYQQVRVLLNASRGRPPAVRRPAPPRLVVPRTQLGVFELLDRLWEYPGPGLGDFYERYKHGRL